MLRLSERWMGDMTAEEHKQVSGYEAIAHTYLLEQIDANARELRGWFVKLFFAVLAIGGTIIVALIGALIALIIAISNSS